MEDLNSLQIRGRGLLAILIMLLLVLESGDKRLILSSSKGLRGALALGSFLSNVLDLLKGSSELSYLIHQDLELCMDNQQIWIHLWYNIHRFC